MFASISFMKPSSEGAMRAKVTNSGRTTAEASRKQTVSKRGANSRRSGSLVVRTEFDKAEFHFGLGGGVWGEHDRHRQAIGALTLLRGSQFKRESEISR